MCRVSEAEFFSYNFSEFLAGFLADICEMSMFVGSMTFPDWAVRKKSANNIKRAPDFYYYSPCLYGLISVCQYGAHVKHLMHIYLYGVSINRMLISQLKRFLGVKFMFPH